MYSISPRAQKQHSYIAPALHCHSKNQLKAIHTAHTLHIQNKTLILSL